MLRPYWITIDQAASRGVGVTATSKDDAMLVYRTECPAACRVISIKPIKDMRDIDQDHVALHMTNWMKRGIWYPRDH